jgi:hypothetical protein
MRLVELVVVLVKEEGNMVDEERCRGLLHDHIRKQVEFRDGIHQIVIRT